MDFLRTCSIILLLVLPRALPSVQAFGVVVVVAWKGHHPQGMSTRQRSPLSSLGGNGRSGRVPVQSSSPFLLKANLFDWLNPSSSKKEKEQHDNLKPKNTNPKETTHHKASATPVVADFLAQWFQSNTPPTTTTTTGTTTTTTTPSAPSEPTPMDDAPIHIQPITTEIVESTTMLHEEDAVSHASLVNHEQEDKPSLLLHHEVVAPPEIATISTLHVPPPPVEATTTPTTTSTAATTTTTTTPMTPMEPPTTTETIHKGRVLWFDPQRGYGFLLPEDNDDENTIAKDVAKEDNGRDPHHAIFVHHSAIELSYGYFRTLIRGEPVEYQVTVDDKGRHLATHVTGPHGKPVKSILQQQLDGPPKGGKGTRPQ